MHAVVLSFPGHFFQTMVCVQRLQKHYPEIERFDFIIDDIQIEPWNTYSQDFFDNIKNYVSKPFGFIKTSTLPGINRCVAGWWRQQLVKLTIDKILSGHGWFVVDGDVIFDSRCEVQNCVPVSFRTADHSRFHIMTLNYVTTMLGIAKGCLDNDSGTVLTNPIPFRLLDTKLLNLLRSHIEDRFQKEFVQLHLDWFDDQTIVADIDPPDRMVMSEWELIECFRRYVLLEQWPLIEIGSGYPLLVDTTNKQQGKNLFRHSYQRDTQIGQHWFEVNEVHVPSQIWNNSQLWMAHNEPWTTR